MSSPKSPSTSAEAADLVALLRNIFTRWDTSGRGVITKEDLTSVMMSVMKRRFEDIEPMMNEIDVNGDGIICWEDFLTWVMSPNATMTTNERGSELIGFDFRRILRPLFDCYDRSENYDFISYEDFEVAHTMIQGALKLFPADAGLEMHAIMELDPKKVFRKMSDRQKDTMISFDEFVEWQKEAMETSGIPNWALQAVITHLVRALKQIFHIDEKSNAGATTSDDHSALDNSIKDVVASSRQLWTKVNLSENSETADPFPNHWCEPPVGLSIDRLIKKNLMENPVRTFHLIETHADVRMCVPDVRGSIEGRPRKWYAKLLRTTLSESSADGTPHEKFYYYKYKGVNWYAMKNPKSFYDALEKMAPDVRLFCLLKAEANMGAYIGWRGIMDALKDGVDMGLLSRRQLDGYRKNMLKVAAKTLKAQGAELDMSSSVRQAAEQLLENKFQIRPQHVMASLAELGVLEMRPLWREFWDDQADESIASRG